MTAMETRAHRKTGAAVPRPRRLADPFCDRQSEDVEIPDCAARRGMGGYSSRH